MAGMIGEPSEQIEDPVLAAVIKRRLEGNLGDAIATLRLAIERRPTDGELFRELGECHRQVGDFARAIQAFQRAIALDPTGLAACQGAAEVALEQADKLGSASKASGNLKKFASACFAALGERQRRQGLIVAEESFRQAVALDGKNAAAWYGLGEFLEFVGRFSEAEKSLRRAIALDPKMAAAHIELGTTLQSLDRYQEMEAAYRRALMLDPNLRHVREGLELGPSLADAVQKQLDAGSNL